MEFVRSNKFDICYYGQVYSLWVKSSVASKWASEHFYGQHLFCWRWYLYLFNLLLIHCEFSKKITGIAHL